MKKFSFWMVLLVLVSVGAMVFIHWKTMGEYQQRSARIQPLYERQKVIASLSASLEKYRRLSSSFRKLSTQEVNTIKDHLRSAFQAGVGRLNQLDSTLDEQANEKQLSTEIRDLLEVSDQVEPTLFSKDAYVKAEVQGLHDKIVDTLSQLAKETDHRMTASQLDSTRSVQESVTLLLGIGLLIFIVLLSLILRSHFTYVRPLQRLFQYANELKEGKGRPQNPPYFGGMYGDIQNVLNQLAQEVETHIRDRHKFIMDIVSDLKAPLTLLQAGKYLLGSSMESLDEERQTQAAESVRRGLTIFSGSLEDLNDIVDINRLESRLEEKTVDLSDLLTDVTRTLMGLDSGKRIMISVPPMPIWVSVDARRMERVFIQLFSKVISTLSEGGGLSISIVQPVHGSFRGIEIAIQDLEKSRTGRGANTGPEQDLLKHWISENGLSMALVSKIIKAHGGTITAAGVAGMSVTITVRLPQERVMSRGLISPPTESVRVDAQGLVVQKPGQSADQLRSVSKVD